MNRSALRRRPVRLFAGLAGGLGLALALGAAAAPSSAGGPITAFTGQLAGVTALSPSSAWAVGSHCTSGCGTGSEIDRTLILRWNGAAWAQVASPNPGGRFRFLSAVSALSPSSAWAVGQYSTISGGNRTLVLRWNGASWARVASPSPEVVDGSFLFGVAAVSPSDAWAAGWSYGLGGENSNTLILRWNGASWAVAHSPNPVHLGFNVLNGVSALSASDAWAVGSTDTGTLILHWNGARWTRVPSPSPGGTGSDVLNGVRALSASDAWAVGSTGTKTLILHWNGASWTRVPSPGPAGGIGSNLSAVSAPSPSDAWAAGSYFTSSGESKTLILRWNGAAWTVVASPNPGGTTGTSLGGVSALSASNVWAVGTTASSSPVPKTLILHWNGASWTRS
jgi:hypothetical protein